MPRWYEMAPSTARSALRLSRAYGFDGPDALTNSLPQNSLVVDVGSGRSKFGHTIAEKRPDIRWINLDLHNGPTRRRRSLKVKNAPFNVRYVGGDVLNLPIRQGSAQRVFSTGLLPHIILDSPELAQQAFKAMGDLLAPEGELAINNLFPKPDSAMHISASEFQKNPDDLGVEVIEYMSLSPAMSRFHKFSNLIGHITLIN